MQLSSIVLIGAFLFACVRLTAPVTRRLCIDDGAVAALALLLLALNATTFQAGDALTLNPASLLLTLCCLWLCGGIPDSVDALLLAVCTGALGYLLCRAFPAAMEPGIPAALPAAVISALVFRRNRTALLSVAAAPLFYALSAAAEEYYSFGLFTLQFGSAAVFDAQVFGIFLFSALSCLPKWRPLARRAAR